MAEVNRAKHYGFRIGPATSPSFESVPRITLEANFYYPQEDALAAYCASTSNSHRCAWNVARPSYIIGAVRDGLLNRLLGISIYASVKKHMGRKLLYPGDTAGWDREHCQSTGLLNGYFEEWVVLNEGAGDAAFNIQDGLPFTWGRFWGELAGWYGVEWEPPERDESKYPVTEWRHKTPPRGYGGRGVTRSTFSLTEWSASPSVQQAWKELTRQHNLALQPFESEAMRTQVFGISDSAIIGGWPLSLSMRKARKMDWHGCVDSIGSAFRTVHDLARLVSTVAPNQPEFVAKD